ncbi:MAG: hypothetical protein R6U84_08930 [Candidatus Cloacimonadales bacterium]
MSKSRFNDLLEILTSTNPSNEQLKKMGLTQSDLNSYRDSSHSDLNNVIYNRILSSDEKRALTPEAFGYVLDLIRIGSIDKQMAEDFIFYSTQLADFVPQKVNKIMIDEIVNYVTFSDKYVTVNDVLELFLVKKNFIQFKGYEN